MEFSSKQQQWEDHNDDPGTTASPATTKIPEIIWHIVNAKLDNSLRGGKSRSRSGIPIRKLHYDVAKDEWDCGSGVMIVNNLFIENIIGYSANNYNNCVAPFSSLSSSSFRDNNDRTDSKNHKKKQKTDSKSSKTNLAISNKNNSNRNLKKGLLTTNDPSKEFLSVTFGDKSQGTDDSNSNNYSKNSNDYNFSYQMDETRERILRNGLISPDGKQIFHLLGCSNSQMSSFSYLFKRVLSSPNNNANSRKKNEDIINNILPNLLQLEKKRGIPKRIKYTGLLFSGIEFFFKLPKDTVINQIRSFANTSSNGKKYDFSDGAGLISIKLMKLLFQQQQQQSRSSIHNHNGMPSVIQIRYGGTIHMLDGTYRSYVCKGILLVDPTETNQNIISFRQSMMKIELNCSSSPSATYWNTSVMQYKLGIIDYSRNNKIGKLNSQIISLLSANIPSKVLLGIQQSHLNHVKNCWHDPKSLAYLAAMMAGNSRNSSSMWSHFEMLILKNTSNINQVKNDNSGGNSKSRNNENDNNTNISLDYFKLVTKRDMFVNELPKLQIHMSCSRILFGTVFPEILHGYLQEGECLVFTEYGLLSDNNCNKVIVARNPSYSPGDVRILRTVALPSKDNAEFSSLHQLRNCIIFSTTGNRPDPDKMSGGDLDGDMYLVIWDKRLIKYSDVLSKEEPEDYDDEQGGKKSNDTCNNGNGDWISYVCRFDNSMLGIVDNAFNMIAKERGVKSKEAKELNRIFSSLVDRNPASLKKLERLIGTCYLPSSSSTKTVRTKRERVTANNDTEDSLSDNCNYDCVWEEMLERQKDCSMQIRGVTNSTTGDGGRNINRRIITMKIYPNFEDYKKFQSSLCKNDIQNSGCSPLQLLLDFIACQQLDHFLGCLDSKKLERMKTLLRSLVSEIAPLSSPGTSSTLAPEEDKKDQCVAMMTQHAALDKEFTKYYRKWENRCNDIFRIHNKQCYEKRQKIIESIQVEKGKKRQQMDIFHTERLQLEDTITLYEQTLNFHEIVGSFRKSEKQLKDRIVKLKWKEGLAKNKLVENTKQLEEIAEQLDSWSSMWKYGTLTAEKTKLEWEKKNWNASLEELKISIIKCSEELEDVCLKRCQFLEENEEQYKHQNSSNSDLTIKLAQLRKRMEILSEEEDMLISGKAKEKIQFDIDKLEAGLIFDKIELKQLEDERAKCNKNIKNNDKERSRLEKSLDNLQTDLSHVNSFREGFEKYNQGIQENYPFFSESMISETSYLSLLGIIDQFKNNWESFWGKLRGVMTDGEKRQLIKVLFDEYTSNFYNTKDVVRNENKLVLESYYSFASDAQLLIEAEQKKYQSILNKLVDSMKEKGDQTNHIKSEVQAIRKKISVIKQKVENIQPFEKKNTVNNSENHSPQNLDELSRLREQEESLLSNLCANQTQLSCMEVEKTKVKRFLKICDDFKFKAQICLNGELKDGIPQSVFLGLADLINGNPAVNNLKKQFDAHVADGNKKRKNVSGTFLIPDPDLFNKYRAFLSLVQDFIFDRIHELGQKIASDTRSLQSNKQESDTLKSHWGEVYKKISIVQEKVDRVSKEIKMLLGGIKRIFCPKELESLENQLEDTGFMDSLEVGKNHVEHCLQNTKKEWIDSSQSNTTNIDDLKQLLAGMDSNCRRICDIEENRLWGYPRNGNRANKLIVYDKRFELQQVLRDADVVIVTAGTGCGKSTQLPQYIVDDFYSHSSGSNASNRKFIRIACTQPRRIAAQKVAARVADEYKTRLGDLIGYRVGMRGSNASEAQKISENTRIEFVTEGWLLFKLTKSPDSILAYDCIVVDEAHERNKETDLLLALLKRHLLDTKTPNLKVVVMSASIDPGRFCEYFGDCPAIDCPGNQKDVLEFYRPAIYLEEDGDNGNGIQISNVVNVLFDDVLYKFGVASNFVKGDCLIFLSGSKQIEQCVEKINERARQENMKYVVAYPLFAQMDKSSQDAATNPHHRRGLDNVTTGKHELSRKIIVCTNIAETSLTIDGVRFVLEGGYAKKICYDHTTRCRGLVEERVARSSTTQRKGRAGRIESGWCFYLYSEDTHEQMEEYDRPKILETPVDDLILYSLDVCGKSIEHLGLLDCPDSKDIVVSKQRLLDLGMVMEGEAEGDLYLTEDGKLACKLNVLDPGGVRMVLTSLDPRLNCFPRALKLAALMSSENEIFIKNFGGRSDAGDNVDSIVQTHDLGDHLLYLKYFEFYEMERSKKRNEKTMRRWCKQSGLSFFVLNSVQGTVEKCYKEMKKRHKIGNCAEDKSAQTESADERLLKAFISGYFNQIAECIVPSLPKNAKFLLLTPTADGDEHRSHLFLHLGKDSCLNALANEDEDEEYDSLDNDLDNVDQTESNEGCRINVNYVLFGSMRSIETRTGQRLLLMLDASIINGRWINEFAPQTWCDRVKFDPEKPSTCRETISTVGAPLLGMVEQWHKKQNLTKVFIKVLRRKHQIRLYGLQEDVSIVKEQIGSLLDTKRKFFIEKDAAECDFNSESLSFNQHTTAIFGSGMVLKGVNLKQDKKRLVDMASWYSVKNSAGWRWEEPTGRYVFPKQQREIVMIYINRGKTIVFLEQLKEILHKMSFLSFKFKPFESRIQATSLGECICKRMSNKNLADAIHKSAFSIAPVDVKDDKKVVMYTSCGDSTGNYQQLLEILRAEPFPFENAYNFNVLDSRIEAIFKGQATSILIDIIHSQKHSFAPQTVEKHPISSRDNFSKNFLLLWDELWENLPAEWGSHCAFWRTLCTTMENTVAKTTSIAFVPSLSRFEIFCHVDHRDDTRERFQKKLAQMCKPQNYFERRIKSLPCSKRNFYQLFALLERVRSMHPVVRFSVLLKTFSNPIDDDSKFSDADEDISLFSPQDEDGIVPFNLSLLHVEEAFEKLEDIRMQANKTPYLTILLQCPWGQDELHRAQSFLENQLGEDKKNDVDMVDKTQKKVFSCYICHSKLIDVRPEKTNNVIVNRVTSKNETTIGLRLMLCGCFCCRECILGSAISNLKMNRPAQCPRCSTIILSKDCLATIRPMSIVQSKKKSKPGSSSTMLQAEQYKLDWIRLSRLAIANFCTELAASAGNKTCWVCPDCDTIMMYFTNQHFIRCRNLKCAVQLCTACKKAPITANDFEKCKARKC